MKRTAVPAVLLPGSPDDPARSATVPPDLLAVTVHPEPSGAVVIAVRGEVDLYTSPLLDDVLRAQPRPDGPPLVIDLTGVDFFGASGLSTLVEAAATGVRLCLVAAGRAVLLPLAITGLDRVFDIHAALTDALLSPGG